MGNVHFFSKIIDYDEALILHYTNVLLFLRSLTFIIKINLLNVKLYIPC